MELKSSDPQNLILELEQAFGEHADPIRGKAMSAYMKNHFPFFGIPSPIRKEICRVSFKKHPISNTHDLLSLVQSMWLKQEREWHYTAIELLSKYKKLWTANLIQTLETMILSNSWWDSVDTLSNICISPYFIRFPSKKREILKKWSESKDLWIIRVCLIHQLSWREKTDTDFLQMMILKHRSSSEFFIQKAIGWSLRQYAKTDSVWVTDLVKNTEMKPLSKREALKNII